LWSSLGIIRETLNILLEGTPRGISVKQIVSSLNDISGVEDVHDIHVWSISSNNHALSCHVRIADMPLSETEAILGKMTELLARQFHIHHTTIQFENVLCTIHPGCVVPIVVSEQQERVPRRN
jgi:cobalt-zinc-cadmium efflux system protein